MVTKSVIVLTVLTRSMPIHAFEIELTQRVNKNTRIYTGLIFVESKHFAVN